MPKFEITGPDHFDDEKQEFVNPVVATVNLEHSLVSLAAWESKWELPFFAETKKTSEQTLDYIHMMCQDDVEPSIFADMSEATVRSISEYIASKQTATWFTEAKEAKKTKKETITAELIYYWMISLQVPFECQHWHVNRLLTLIKVCNAKNSPDKKMSKKEVMENNRRLNAQRKAQMGITG